jgi:hypothetical protein
MSDSSNYRIIYIYYIFLWNCVTIFSWKGVFVDKESGIDHYSWAIGTQVGYCDISEFNDTLEECGTTPTENPLNLTDGFAYFITVKVNK